MACNLGPFSVACLVICRDFKIYAKVGNQVLNLVIRNAIEYYSNKSSKGFNDLINNVMDDDE